MPENSTIHDDIATGEQVYLLSDVRNETFLPRPQGRKLDKSTLFRWTTRGVGGVKLESYRTPGGIVTTRSSVIRFFEKLSGGGASAATTPTPTRRRQAVERARRQLESAGIS